MKTDITKYEEQFLDYVENTLQGAERAEFEGALAESAELRASLAAYREIIALESAIAGEVLNVPEMNAASVVREIRTTQQEDISTKLAQYVSSFGDLLWGHRLALGGLASIVLLVTITYKIPEGEVSLESFYREQQQAKREAAPAGPVVAQPLADSNEPVAASLEETTPVKPTNAITASIPEGYRAITIETDLPSSIEGNALPGSKVDLAVTLKDKKGTRTSVIAQNAKVLSVERDIKDSSTPAKSSFTVLVPKEDADNLQAAQNAGEVSALLRGDADTGSVSTDLVIDELSARTNRQASSSNNGRMRIGDKEYSIEANGSLTLNEPNDPSVPSPLLEKSKVLNKREGQRDQSFKQIITRSEDKNAEQILGGKLTGYAKCMGCITDDLESYTPPQTTESYSHYDENPRISPRDEALSTFSIDVDTGSYTNVRRFLENGNMPPPDAVRIEEFLNYFDYNYPSQSEKPFTLSYEIAPSPLENGRHLLKLGIKARESARSDKGWNLVFLVDVSGSMMEENKLPLVKKALSILANKMRAEDSIAIVTYAGNAGVALESTSGKERTKILSAIENLEGGGSTHGSAGIKLAYQIAEDHKRAGAVNRVILATDGDFNVGTTSQDELIKIIEEKRKSGVTLTTIGVGTDNLKDGLIEQLANKGNGNYFYLDSLKEARKVMETDIAGNMEVVAKDVKLQIEFNPEHVVQYRLIGYDNRRLDKQDFNNDKIDAGEIGSGHTVTALYEVVLKGDADAAQLEAAQYRYKDGAKKEGKVVEKESAPTKFAPELAFLKIRYKAPDGDRSQLLEYPIEMANVHNSAKETSDDFRFAAAVSYFGHLLRQSKYAGDYSYSEIATLAKDAKGKDERGYRQEFIELVRNAGVSERAKDK